jgi:hypothetical protein
MTVSVAVAQLMQGGVDEDRAVLAQTEGLAMKSG